ncbi:beta-1,3-galactosyltransferase 5-like [Xyrauchen texanus]|uniref:beta-1,3-galactosyltransferase 5-like n=1 Tax=Xyrauchen texanus TaxID=154827 RepID=UPI0022420010|nr:beta-1,3-galactosyltransferase 5-like [Xyrauchen texanus]
MEVRVSNQNSWKRCSLTQNRAPYKSHTKKGLFLLFIFAFLVFAIFNTMDYSFKPVLPSNTMYNKVLNQISYYYVVVEFPSDRENKTNYLAPLPKANQQVLQRTTTTIEISVTAESTVTKHISVDHVAYPRNYHFILDEPDTCHQQNPFLVLMVPVAPHQLAARNAIRSTWGNESTVQGKTVMTLFVVGLSGGADADNVQQQLQEESRQHRDLLQSNFVDTYANLTTKTMVIMDWLSTRCAQATFGMKVDSDMFLNVENLMTLLLAPNTLQQNYITGMVMWNQAVIRNQNSKWYVAEEMYPDPNYPVYLLGMGYVFSNDLPNKLVEVSKDIKPFNIEDAYVGACLKRLGVQPSNPPDPSQFRSYLEEYKRDEFLRVITTILNSPQQLIEFWHDLKTLS